MQRRLLPVLAAIALAVALPVVVSAAEPPAAPGGGAPPLPALPEPARAPDAGAAVEGAPASGSLPLLPLPPGEPAGPAPLREAPAPAAAPVEAPEAPAAAPPATATSPDACAEHPEACPRPRPPNALPANEGLQIGGRLAYSLPTGLIAANRIHVSDLQTAWVPLGFDLGQRLSRKVYVGGSLLWGLGTDPTGSSTTCTNSGVSCWRQETQLRGEVRYYFKPDSKVGGWFSAGVGWEIATFTQSTSAQSTTSTFNGLVLPDLEIGFDVRNGALAIGPYFGLTWSTFLTEGRNPALTPVSTGISDHAVHTWISLGLRGSYGPW